MSNLNNELIEVEGARVHNLKNIDVSIPKNKLVVITGISGSGKSSLAFDTIYAEGQRRYMETFGAYARQFVGDMERPDVDKITGLSPVISIEQKTTNKNPRSTVGTITEVYDFMRLLFARIGEAYSYNTGKKMVKWSEEEIVDNIFKRFDGQKISLLAPLVRGRKGHYRELFEEIRKKGFVKVRVDGEIKDLVPKMQVDRYKIHDIEVVVDRLKVSDDFRVRISQSVQQTLKMGKDLMMVLPESGEEKTNSQKSKVKSKNSLFENEEGIAFSPLGAGGVALYSKQLMCEDTGLSYEEPSPNAFSFNSPYGACPTCKGLGNVFTIDMDEILPDTSLSVKEGGIKPLGEEREASVFNQVIAFAKKYKIKLDVPVSKLPKEQLDLLLFGDKNINPSLEVDVNDETVPDAFTGSYEGIIPMLKRWFSSSHSTEGLREWVQQFMTLKTCGTCNGARLKKESLWFKIEDRNIAELSEFNLDNLAAWFDGLELRISNKQATIAKDVLKEIRERLQFLLNVGLTYLTLNRSSRTLSGGESQRIRLATQIGSQLQGITYILDEPSIGL
ncbi:MAG: excinuclease ABC subunit UvrA, partial [Chitinophagaceae bacterium]